MSADARAVHREDGELLGFLVRAGGGDGGDGDGRQDQLAIPTTVFGTPVGIAQPAADAEASLHALGLAYLIDRWEWAAGAEWLTVELVEAGPDGVTVQIVDFGHPDRYGERRRLHAPVGTDTLRRR